MAEVPRYQRGEKSSAAAPRDAKRQRTQPFAAQTCMACDGPLAASTAPDANGLLLCGRCVKFNNNAKPRKPREKVVPPPTRKEALAEYWLVAQTLADTSGADADAVARLAPVEKVDALQRAIEGLPTAGPARRPHARQRHARTGTATSCALREEAPALSCTGGTGRL